MDVLTEQEVRVDAGAAFSRLFRYAPAAAYATLLCVAVAHHEAWADEAQSWLLARDASLPELWTRLLHYEGTTGLWQTLLHILIGAGLPYWGMNVFSAVLGLAAACVMFWRAPFPLPIRVGLPFTFFLCYQYAVIARSYDLLPLLLFCCAAIYHQREKEPRILTILLCVMAAASVHGMVLAMAIGVSVLVSSTDRRRLTAPAIGFAAVIVLLSVAAWPAADGTFISGLNLSIGHVGEITLKAFANAFTGEPVSSLLVVALSIPLLWRGGGWLVFLLATLGLCGVAALIYSQVWHHGLLFLAWLFAVWISWPRSSMKARRLPYQLAVVALVIVVAVQCYWAAASIAYDWRQPYSGSRAAAQGLTEMNLTGKRLYAIGYACTAIQPYFPSNIFANVNDGRPAAYWDWSRRNHVNPDSLHLAETRPDYVMVGYKNEFERGVWTGLVEKSGYRAIRHFGGNTFWEARILEPDSYDLYQRSTAP